jgi:hypothetical protein
LALVFLVWTFVFLRLVTTILVKISI